MKYSLVIFCILMFKISVAQETNRHHETMDFLEANGIKLYSVVAPSGFTVYYNCDSDIFMKGIFGDTIKIYTAAIDHNVEFTDLKEVIKNESFGKTQFLKSVDDDGYTIVSSYAETDFLFRNDSLFEIADTTHFPSELFAKIMEDVGTENFDEDFILMRIDSLLSASESQSVYIPKFIFTKTMFEGRKRIKLPKDLNFAEDTIEIQDQWVKNGKQCYLVRIHNEDEEGRPISYAYAIDEDMRFVWWEDCDED